MVRLRASWWWVPWAALTLSACQGDDGSGAGLDRSPTAEAGVDRGQDAAHGDAGRDGARLPDATVRQPSAPDAGSDASSCTGDTFSGWPSQFFANQCARCHGRQFARHRDVQRRARTIAAYIRAGSMPPGGGLSATERARILTYLDCGAP